MMDVPLAKRDQAAVSSVQKDMDQVCSSLQESIFRGEVLKIQLSFPFAQHSLETPDFKVG